MAKTLIVLGKAWLWAAAALTLLAYAYVWWTEGLGKWRNQRYSASPTGWRSSSFLHRVSSY